MDRTWSAFFNTCTQKIWKVSDESFRPKTIFSQVINSSVYCRFNCLTKFFWYLIPFSFSTFLIKILNTCPDPQHGQVNLRSLWGPLSLFGWESDKSASFCSQVHVGIAMHWKLTVDFFKICFRYPGLQEIWHPINPWLSQQKK